MGGSITEWFNALMQTQNLLLALTGVIPGSNHVSGKFYNVPRLCSNGARSREATNISFQATETKFPVAQPGTLAFSAVFTLAGRKIKRYILVLAC